MTLKTSTTSPVYYTIYYPLLNYFKFLQQKLLNVLPYKEEKKFVKTERAKNVTVLLLSTTITLKMYHYAKKNNDQCVYCHDCLNTTTITRDSILFMMGTLNYTKNLSFFKKKLPNIKSSKKHHTKLM